MEKATVKFENEDKSLLIELTCRRSVDGSVEFELDTDNAGDGDGLFADVAANYVEFMMNDKK